MDTGRGHQFDPDFLKLNPNGKAPVIVDDGAAIFDSTAILLYLADKMKRHHDDVGKRPAAARALALGELPVCGGDGKARSHLYKHLAV